jgi:hypothetical protein
MQANLFFFPEILAQLIILLYLCSGFNDNVPGRRAQKNKTMEKNQEERRDQEIVYSRSVKAGKRIYYLDVRKARNEDLYLCITESKRRQGEEGEAPSFEKHKVFLYKEDFAHFTEGLQDVIAYVQDQLGTIESRPEWTPEEKAADAEPEAEETKKKGLLGFLRK